VVISMASCASALHADIQDFSCACACSFSLSLFDIRNKEICEISGHQQKKNIPV
jgi:hypothetical protein